MTTQEKIKKVETLGWRIISYERTKTGKMTNIKVEMRVFFKRKGKEVVKQQVYGNSITDLYNKLKINGKGYRAFYYDINDKIV